MKNQKTRVIPHIAHSLGLFAGVFGLSIGASAQEFSYNGDNGPTYWPELSSSWGACAGDGMAQSPINIASARPDSGLRPLELYTAPTTVDIFNNGHTIEQHYEDTGTFIVFEHVTYELLQFHFHTLSEHTVGGSHAVMEMHAVFSDGAGSNLVIGQLFDIGNGQSGDQFIQMLIDAGLPARDGDETVTDDLIDLSDGLKSTANYYTYSGSLTTPPCSEVVTWVVLKDRATLAMEQYQAFRRILGNNFRPIQDTAGREVRVTLPGRGNGRK